jgi:hypothetical protein
LTYIWIQPNGIWKTQKNENLAHVVT